MVSIRVQGIGATMECITFTNLQTLEMLWGLQWTCQ